MTSELSTRVEVLRDGIGLVPAHDDPSPGLAVYIRAAGKKRPAQRSCSCSMRPSRTCAHLRELSEAIAEFRRKNGGAPWEETFRKTAWHALSRSIFDGGGNDVGELSARVLELGRRSVLSIASRTGGEILRYETSEAARQRLLDRLGLSAHGDGSGLSRWDLLERLTRYQETTTERMMSRRGISSIRQLFEAGFWFRLAYHMVREYGFEAGLFQPRIHLGTGQFTLLFSCPNATDGAETASDDEVRVTVPRACVRAALSTLQVFFPAQKDLAIHPIPLRTLFRIDQTTEVDIEFRPIIEAIQAGGEKKYYESEELEKFRYGSLVYLREAEILAEVERPGHQRTLFPPEKVKLSHSQLPGLLDDLSEEIAEGRVLIGNTNQKLSVHRKHDSVEFAPEAMDRRWTWLSVKYRFQGHDVGLDEILQARSEGRNYLATPVGWIDLKTAWVEALPDPVAPSDRQDADRGLRFSALSALRLESTAQGPVEITGRGDLRRKLRGLFELSPAKPYVPPEGFKSVLRDYQKNGADWLLFLYENGLSGLLCDEMGLGKTHQSMALLSRVAADSAKCDFLVVCPRTVISHWRTKLEAYAPRLCPVIYHGSTRRLDDHAAGARVVLTSYGVLRRGDEQLRKRRFNIVIFDEIQHLKNRRTIGYSAAAQLEADMLLGLTGTPIENSVDEMKNLFDLILPGYLDGLGAFDAALRSARAGMKRYTESDFDKLSRTVAPFILRRSKERVLEELPEKIEDTRTCELSEQQVALYRQAVARKGAPLIEQIRGKDGPLPYIHIFALLDLLKQICNHPALALNDLDNADRHQSAKWDLFQEILAESLDSGQKVVVFSQYLGMLDLVGKLLDAQNIDHVVLTGKSRRRGTLIDRFNNDENCRVFVGSLKAGGTGIDLIGGSVVIHYDRWWNAAREDQATDRVHRIGQKRVVQVFKLINEGTLEEKIDAIIENKRALLHKIVREDDASLRKIFTREQILDLLDTAPG